MKHKNKSLSFLIIILFLSFVVKASELDKKIHDLSTQIGNSLSEQNKTRIAVIEFSYLDGTVTRFGKYLAEELTNGLFKIRSFDVIERTLLNKILSEHKLTQSGVVDPMSAKKIGKISGSDAIVSGTIADLGTYLKVNARLISTETGQIFSVASVEIKKDENVNQLLLKDNPNEIKKISNISKKGDGLKAEYYNMPQYTSTPGPFGDVILTRVDENIDFSWSRSSPSSRITSDFFGVCWSGKLYAPITGTYQFRICIEEYDATRLLLNNKTIIDHWNFRGRYHKPLKYGESRGCPDGKAFLKGGQWYNIRVDYYEDDGEAGVHLNWIAPGENTFGIIPSKYLKPN